MGKGDLASYRTMSLAGMKYSKLQERMVSVQSTISINNVGYFGNNAYETT